MYCNPSAGLCAIRWIAATENTIRRIVLQDTRNTPADCSLPPIRWRIYLGRGQEEWNAAIAVADALPQRSRAGSIPGSGSRRCGGLVAPGRQRRLLRPGNAPPRLAPAPGSPGACRGSATVCGFDVSRVLHAQHDLTTKWMRPCWRQQPPAAGPIGRRESRCVYGILVPPRLLQQGSADNPPMPESGGAPSRITFASSLAGRIRTMPQRPAGHRRGGHGGIPPKRAPYRSEQTTPG